MDISLVLQKLDLSPFMQLGAEARICKRRGILPVIFLLFSMNLSLSNQITHTDIVNQSEASKSELVSSLSVYESK